MTPDRTLCLAHEADKLPRHERVPPAFCQRYIDCDRHQAINLLKPSAAYIIKTRVSKPGQLDAFVPLHHLGKLQDGECEGSEA